MSDSPIICHISGASGSGKTTIGERLLQRYSDFIAVKDTDEFFNDCNSVYDDLKSCADETEYEKLWLKIRDIEVNKFIVANASKHIIIFVGLLDHCGPINRPIKYALSAATLRYYIEIDSANFLKQYFTRVCVQALTNQGFWKDIAAGRTRIDSSSDKLKENSDLQKKHVAEGYEVISTEYIFVKIAQMLEWCENND